MTSDNQKRESIRITSKHMTLEVIVFTGKDGDYFIRYIPSLNLSGYGKTNKEAEESLITSVEAFGLDLKVLPTKKREQILLELGWHQEKLKKKNFSHAFVDSEGVLQNLGLDLDHVEESALELTL